MEEVKSCLQVCDGLVKKVPAISQEQVAINNLDGHKQPSKVTDAEFSRNKKTVVKPSTTTSTSQQFPQRSLVDADGQRTSRDNNIASTVEDVSVSGAMAQNSPEKDGFKEVSYKIRRGNTIIGKRTDSNSLKAVEPKSWIFVSRLHPSTTANEIEQYARDNGISIFDCERLQIRSPDIAAFKFSVPKRLENKSLSEDSWPVNAIVRRYHRHSNFQKTTPRLSPV